MFRAKALAFGWTLFSDHPAPERIVKSLALWLGLSVRFKAKEAKQ